MLETAVHVEIRGKRDPFSETNTNCLNGLGQYMSKVYLWRLWVSNFSFATDTS